MEDKSKGLSKSHSGASYRDSIHMYSVLGIGCTGQEKGSKLLIWISWTIIMCLVYSQKNNWGEKCGFLIIYFLQND